ncbi:hypothetical protein GCM10011515_10310 [Tsuneonella deserti]|uniref:Uncharacterized protein n=1 Tax=Tsuneonella deserti TaxID=2035528 RepID=A0ABQ1S6L4_9SPHN|nr:hypothetical protein [Tsuneonella deserti]GGD92524.1 hypothetical protein GCM10011515_10310 [Tsuneonella deserti]
MTDLGAVQIVVLLGWLILAGSAIASYRLGWKENVRMGLTWAGIFIAVALAFSLVAR